MVTLPPELANAPELPLLLQAAEFRLQNEKLARNDYREWLTPEQNGEFINGRIIHSTPWPLFAIQVRQDLAMLMHAYANKHSLGEVIGPKNVVVFTRNDYQPDIAFYSAEHAEFYPQQCLFPVPDLIVEILLPSTEAIDRGLKYRDYEAHGVAEYWMIDPEAKSVERFKNERGQFKAIPDREIIETILLPGLEIPFEAIFETKASHALFQGIYSR